MAFASELMSLVLADMNPALIEDTMSAMYI